MNPENTTCQESTENSPGDVLQKLVGVFASKGWLNQTLRIKYRNRRYRISCSEKEFFAYRINDNCYVSPGFPGWLVCFVTPDHIVNDAEMCPFPSTEPSIHDWLQCIVEHDFELI